MALAQDIGFVLHARRYRENSRVLELFTRAHGRLAVVARVGQKQAVRTLATLQPFVEAQFSWRGRTTLQNLDHADAIETYLLAGEAGVCGLYCNELLLYLTLADLPLPELYDVYGDTLRELAQGEQNAAGLLRRFEWALLETLGYAFSCEDDWQTQLPLTGSGPFYFTPERGLSAIPTERGSVVLSSQGLACLRAREFQSPGAGSQLRPVLRAALDHLLGNRQLKSRLLLQSMQKYRQ